jgi:hypothetical protein
MLWCAYLAVRIAQDLDGAAEKSQQHAVEMFAKEEANQSKAAGKMKSLMYSRDALQVWIKCWEAYFENRSGIS